MLYLTLRTGILFLLKITTQLKFLIKISELLLNKKADFLTQRSSSPEHECLPAEPAARKKRPQLKAELYAHSPYQQFFLNFLIFGHGTPDVSSQNSGFKSSWTNISYICMLYIPTTHRFANFYFENLKNIKIMFIII